MIVNKRAEGWEIVFQRAHGLLAAKIAAFWPAQARPERWVETLAAIAQHDNERPGWEGHRWLDPAGAPLDFRERAFDLEQITQVAAAARYQSRWVALLTSRHLDRLYGSLREAHPTLDAFLDEQQALRTRWRRALGVRKDEVSAAYRLMYWSDRLSLLLCGRDLPDDGYHLELGAGPDQTMHTVAVRDDGSILVEPWPFEPDRLALSVEAYYPEGMTFAVDEELQQALESAPVETLNWTFRRR